MVKENGETFPREQVRYIETDKKDKLSLFVFFSFILFHIMVVLVQVIEQDFDVLCRA